MVAEAVSRFNNGDASVIRELWDEDADYVGVEGTGARSAFHRTPSGSFDTNRHSIGSMNDASAWVKSPSVLAFLFSSHSLGKKTPAK